MVVVVKDVRQGDSLSPYLFIIAMQALTVALREACNSHHFHGLVLSENAQVSHLMYADDVTFIGEWSEVNLINLNRLLRCFYLCSGLKVNLHKSRVYGIGVEDLEVSRLSSILNCEASSFPFAYLGVPIGANMRLAKNWNPVIEKFRTRLSRWKAKNISFGGRVTLINSVLCSIPLYYLSLFKAPKKVLHTLDGIRRRFLWGGDEDKRSINWVSWEMVTTSKEKGGLGVGRLTDLNLSLLLKWWWRLKSNGDSLWCKCIKSLHNLNFVDGKLMARKSLKGVWMDIACIGDDFMEKGVEVNSLFSRSVGKGNKTYFWKDLWLGDGVLKDIFPNLYALEKNKNCLVSDRVTCSLLGSNSGPIVHLFSWDWSTNLRKGRESDQFLLLTSNLQVFNFGTGSDCWRWNGDGGKVFSTKAVRRLLSDAVYGPQLPAMHWVNWVPSKVKGFMWKLLQNRLPTLDNLIKRGVHVSEVICPFCRAVNEDLNHIMFECGFAKDVWNFIRRWSNFDLGDLSSICDFRKEVEHWRCDRNSKKLKLSVIYATMWHLWKARNSLIFRNVKRSFRCTVDDIVSWSFNWIKFRSKFSSLIWFKWCMSPYLHDTL